MFQKKGLITVNVDNIDEDKLMALVLDAGGEDLQVVDEIYQVVCDTKVFNSIRKALSGEGVNIDSAEISWIPSNYIELNEKAGRSVISLIEALENHDDVQNVYANSDFPKDLLAEV